MIDLRAADVLAMAERLGHLTLRGQAAAQRVALVLGGADCLFDDVKALRQILAVDRCPIIAVNDAGFRWPGPITAWVTLHPEELAWRIERRRGFGYPMEFTTWTRPYPFGLQERERLCDRVLGGWDRGSSGFFGVGVALELGFERIVLAGIPMDERPHLGRAGAPWLGHPTYRPAWLERRAELAPFLRSMSGWTRELYGAPHAEWLDTGAFVRQ